MVNACSLPKMSAKIGNISYKIIDKAQHKIVCEANYGSKKYIYERTIPQLRYWENNDTSKDAAKMLIQLPSKKRKPVYSLEKRNRKHADIFCELAKIANALNEKYMQVCERNVMATLVKSEFKQEFNQTLDSFEQKMKKTIDEKINEMKKGIVDSDSKQANKRANLITKIKIFLLTNHIVISNATEIFEKIMKCPPKAIKELNPIVYELGGKMQKALEEFESKEMNEKNLDKMSKILTRITVDSVDEIRTKSNKLVPDFISLFEKWFGDSNNPTVKLKIKILKMMENMQNG